MQLKGVNLCKERSRLLGGREELMNKRHLTDFEVKEARSKESHKLDFGQGL